MDKNSYIYNKCLKLAESLVLHEDIGNFGKKHIKEHFLSIDAVYVNGYKCFRSLSEKSNINSVEIVMFYTDCDDSRKYANIELSEQEVIEFKGNLFIKN